MIIKTPEEGLKSFLDEYECDLVTVRYNDEFKELLSQDNYDLRAGVAEKNYYKIFKFYNDGRTHYKIVIKANPETFDYGLDKNIIRISPNHRFTNNTLIYLESVDDSSIIIRLNKILTDDELFNLFTFYKESQPVSISNTDELIRIMNILGYDVDQTNYFKSSTDYLIII